MKYWHTALALLFVIALVMTVHCVRSASGLERMRSLLRDKDTEVSSLHQAWRDAASYLSWSVLGQELEEMEEDLATLEQTARDDPAFSTVLARIERRLARLYEGFVPSLSGIF